MFKLKNKTMNEHELLENIERAQKEYEEYKTLNKSTDHFKKKMDELNEKIVALNIEKSRLKAWGERKRKGSLTN
jgi:hypothetical protein